MCVREGGRQKERKGENVCVYDKETDNKNLS